MQPGASRPAGRLGGGAVHAAHAYVDRRPKGAVAAAPRVKRDRAAAQHGRNGMGSTTQATVSRQSAAAAETPPCAPGRAAKCGQRPAGPRPAALGFYRGAVAALRACAPRAGHCEKQVQTRTQKRMSCRKRALAARSAAARDRAGPAAEWVVDTGASRHICAPSAAQGAQRATECVVETANGTVKAAGEATVYVPGIRKAVEAVVLPKSPCLLSMGLLVQDGYELRWGPDACELQVPGGGVAKLKVRGGVPILEDEAVAQRAGRCAAMAAGQEAVVEGVAEVHRQQGHYPWRGDCAVCCESSLRSTQHRRRPPHAGVLAVDIAALGGAGPYVLVGATQQPGWVYAEPTHGKAAWQLREPLLRMVAAARARGHVATVHADNDAGLVALEPSLLALGVTLTTTQGRDPQANGLAEQAVGQLSRMARAVLAEYSAGTAAALWQCAMVWAAQRIVDPKLTPFGAAVLARLPPMANLGKLAPRATQCVNLHKSTRTPGAIHVGLLTKSGSLRGTAERRTVRAALAPGGAWRFPDVREVRMEVRGRQATHTQQASDSEDDAEATQKELVEHGGEHADDAQKNIRRACGELSEHFLTALDDDVREQLQQVARSGGPGEAGQPEDAEGDAERPRADKRRRREAEFGEETKKRKGAVEGDVVDEPVRGDVEMQDNGAASQTWPGYVTRVISTRAEEAKTPEAQEAMRAEVDNIVSKKTFDPQQVCDWHEVRQRDKAALIGTARMILGCKTQSWSQASGNTRDASCSWDTTCTVQSATGSSAPLTSCTGRRWI